MVEWSTKQLSQSSPFVSVSNTLTLRIKGSISLSSVSSGDSSITLSGLTGVTSSEYPKPSTLNPKPNVWPKEMAQATSSIRYPLLTVTRLSGTSWVSAGVLFCADSTALTTNKVREREREARERKTTGYEPVHLQAQAAKTPASALICATRASRPAGGVGE